MPKRKKLHAQKSDERLKLLQEQVIIATDNYEHYVCAQTKKQDKNYLKKLELFFKECKENQIFIFLDNINSAMDLFNSDSTGEQIDVFWVNLSTCFITPRLPMDYTRQCKNLE